MKKVTISTALREDVVLCMPSKLEMAKSHFTQHRRFSPLIKTNLEDTKDEATGNTWEIDWVIWNINKKSITKKQASKLL